jgi:hypothetical protein
VFAHGKTALRAAKLPPVELSKADVKIVDRAVLEGEVGGPKEG